jgi:hypothetical protein
MKWPLHAKIGIGLIFIGFGPFAFLELWTHAHNWTPIDVPIVLKTGEFRSPEFKSELNQRYLISLGIDQLRGPALDREQCMLGVGLPRSVLNCDGVEQTVDFDWQVISDRGEVLQSGSYHVTSIGPPGVGFTEFQGSQGSRQKVVLKIKRDAGELNNFHPRLVVEIGPENWEALPYLSFFFLIWAGALSVLGMLIILVPFGVKAMKEWRGRTIR